jgi:hypothetical protein
MPKYRITGPDGQSYEVNAPDGASEQDVLAYAQRTFKMAAAPKPREKGFGEQLNDFVADTPRQLGLTARYGLEGVGNVLDTLASPIRAGLNAVLPNKAPTVTDQITGAKPRPAIEAGSGRALADMLSLPQPQNARERIVGDAARLVAGGAVPIGTGAALARATGTAANVGRVLASNPGQQLASAGASGLAGGYTRETGGNETSQIIASLGAGLATPFAMNAVGNAAGKVGQAAARAVGRGPQVDPARIDGTINAAMQDAGVTLADLPPQVAQSIRADVAKAYQLGDELSPDAVRRLADYRLTGLTPTRARLTLDPAEVTRQANLAKQGANSMDPAAQALARTQNTNNKALTSGLNELGAATADDQIAGAGKIMGALSARNAKAKSIIDAAYQGARDTSGRSAMLDSYAFHQKANALLDNALLGGKLPGDVRNLLDKAAAGEMPLTVDVAEQFKTRIGDLQRATSDMAERKALGMVRSALDDAPLLPGQSIGKESIDAFNKARALNRTWMSIVDKTPALQAVRDGIEPDKFVQQFVIGSGPKANVADLWRLKSSIKSSPEAMGAVKEQITAFLKNKALSGADDEVGNFSQSAYNKALNAIGERKLRLFFEPQEVAQLKAIGRVASYEQVQPAGAAVNNSNTAGAVGGMLERLGAAPILAKIPLGRAAIGEPLQNIILSRQAGTALNAPAALVAPGRPPMLPGAARTPMMISPAAVLGAEDEETRRRRQLGLLTP